MNTVKTHKVGNSLAVTIPKELGISEGVDGFVNPMQLYTFDFIARNTSKITQLDTWTFQKVVQLYNYIFE